MDRTQEIPIGWFSMIKDDKCEITQIKQSNQIKETPDKYVAKLNYNLLT